MGEKKHQHPKVKDLMVDVKEFHTIPIHATFYEAHGALEKAQKDFLAGRSKYRTLLVEDEKGTIVGKLSPMDLIQGLEPKYADVIDTNRLRFKDILYVIESEKHKKVLWERPFDQLCRTAMDTRIKSFITLPVEGHKLRKDDSLDEALHLFAMTRHDTLFVMDGNKLVGLLIFADVYDYISKTIEETCTLS